MGVEKFNLPRHPKYQDKMVMRTHFPCHKQPPQTGYCGYYVMEFLKVQGRYRTNPEDLDPIPKTHNKLKESDLLNMVADLSRFTMHEVVNRRGAFFDPEGDIEMTEKFRPLGEWEYHPF
ncbi:hypothetical protein BS78_09G102800 [Paspalum vaginatum]|nr:hypothetical protein BS78_09G102800 [Paspalum vaginatum]